MVAEVDGSESCISDIDSEDVVQTVAALGKLRSENVELRRNFESVKGLYIQLQDTYRNLQGRYTALYDERVAVEKQYQSLCESWKVELEEKQKQLEQVKAQLLGPKDFDLIRIKLLEDAEGPWKAKCDNLAKEAEIAQANYMRMRRDYEELQSTYKGMELRSVKESELLRADRSSLLRELKDKGAALVTLQGKYASLESSQCVLAREHESAKYSAVQMAEELQEVRHLKERSVVQREGAVLSAERKLREVQEENAALVALVESSSRKARHLAGELADAQRSAEELFAAHLRLQSANAQLSSQLDLASKSSAAERGAMVSEHEAAYRKLEDRVHALLGEVGRKDGEMARERMLHQEESSQLVATWEAKLASEQRAASERMRELQEARAQAVAQADTAFKRAEERVREVECDMRELRAEADSQAREAGALQGRVDAMERQLTQSQEELTAAKAELADTKGELVKAQLLADQMSERYEAAHEQLAVTEANLQQVIEAREALSRDLDAQRSSAAAAAAAAAAHADAAKRAFALEKGAAAKRFQAALRDVAVQHEALAKKLKRRVKAAQQAASGALGELADAKLATMSLQHSTHMAEVLTLHSPPGGGRPYSSGPSYGYYPPGTAGRPYSSVTGIGSVSSSGPYNQYHVYRPTSPNVVIVTPEAFGGQHLAGVSSENAQAGGSGVDGHGGGGGSGAVDAALLSSIAALRARQQEYLDAARSGLSMQRPGSAG